MPLRENGILELHDLYFTLGNKIEGLLKEMDKIITTDDGADVDVLSDVVTLLADSIQEFSDDADIIYSRDFIDETDDVDFDINDEI